MPLLCFVSKYALFFCTPQLVTLIVRISAFCWLMVVAVVVLSLSSIKMDWFIVMGPVIIYIMYILVWEVFIWIKCLYFYNSEELWNHLPLKSILAEFMQYLIPVLSRGPSSKTWPRWASQLLHLTSVLTIPKEVSLIFLILASLSSSKKAGHPHPL